MAVITHVHTATTLRLFCLPEGSPDPLPELETYLDSFTPLFRRISLDRYVTGLLTDFPRNNCATVARMVANMLIEQLQHLLTDAPSIC